jgi:heme/copper-type cytochrome/quinol oxidase subunit 1
MDSESNLQANPYQPPAGVDIEERDADRAKIGMLCFWLAVVCWVIGFISFFIRNSPPLGWFLVAAGLLVPAIAYSGKPYRFLAVIALMLCILTGSITSLAHYRRLQALRAQQQAIEAEAAAIAEYEAAMIRAAQTP